MVQYILTSNVIGYVFRETKGRLEVGVAAENRDRLQMVTRKFGMIIVMIAQL
jgi:hypothetical protein